MAVTTGCCNGGGEWDCSHLDDCSITDLSDVDTTTEEPSEGDTLVWDGSQWVPGSPVEVVGGETNTTETSVSGGGDDPYEVTTDVKTADGDNAVSVEDDGLFVPKHYFDAMQLELTTASGFNDLDEIVTPGSGRQTLGSTIGLFSNPSPTLSMRVVLEVSVNHGQFGFYDPNTLVQTYSRLEIRGAVETLVQAHQRVRENRDGRAEYDFMGSTKSTVITIPPGESVTIELLGQMDLPVYSGRANMNELNHLATIWGGTFQ